MRKKKKIVIIGNGIAAWALLNKLAKRDDLSLINISADHFFPPCSYASTAINCLRGTRANVSELGDKILKAMEEFEQFYQKHHAAGIEQGHEYQILEEKTRPKWQRRYPEFFNIQENEFLNNIVVKKSLYYKSKAYFINPEKLSAIQTFLVFLYLKIICTFFLVEFLKNNFVGNTFSLE